MNERKSGAANGSRSTWMGGESVRRRLLYHKGLLPSEGLSKLRRMTSAASGNHRTRSGESGGPLGTCIRRVMRNAFAREIMGGALTPLTLSRDAKCESPPFCCGELVRQSELFLENVDFFFRTHLRRLKVCAGWRTSCPGRSRSSRCTRPPPERTKVPTRPPRTCGSSESRLPLLRSRVILLQKTQTVTRLARAKAHPVWHK